MLCSLVVAATDIHINAVDKYTQNLDQMPALNHVTTVRVIDCN